MKPRPVVLSGEVLHAEGSATVDAVARALGRQRVRVLSIGRCKPAWGAAGAAALAATEGLASVRRLRFVENAISTAGARALAESPHVRGLRTLDLSRQAIMDEGLTALARSSRLERLEALTVADDGLRAPSVRAFSDGLPALRGVDLSHNLLAGADLQPLAARPLETLALAHCGLGVAALRRVATMPTLRVLRWSGNETRAQAGSVLARAAFSATLESLELGYTGLGDAGASSLARGKFPALVTLSLRAEGIGARGAAALGGGHYPALRSLDLWNDAIGPAGLVALAKNATLRGLTTLNLWSNRIDGPALAALLASCERLEALELAANGIGVVGARALAASPALARMARLSLEGNRIGDEGLAALAVSPGFAAVEVLLLPFNAIGPAGTRALATSRTARSLRELVLDWNEIGDDGAKALSRARLPKLARLSLFENGIGPAGAAAFAESSVWRRLHTFVIERNSIPPGVVRALQKGKGDRGDPVCSPRG